jgi:predicted short-subunit dehydrogenase-like oxidoreductase (DUF2520 family)
MLKITIIGSGNVAQHLISAFQKSNEIEILQVFARNLNTLSDLIDSKKIVSDFMELLPSDLFIIAVSDNAIANVSSKITFDNQLVVHTSGGMALEVLDNKHRKGVFYPLQSFTKNKAVDFQTIPICIEAENDLDFYFLEKVAHVLTNKTYNINSLQRKSLHISAVFVNNFVNHLYQIANEICEENQVDFDILKPLIVETANKILEIKPQLAQTGPAKRNDSQVIENHIASLNNDFHKNIYKILTQSIQQNGN